MASQKWQKINVPPKNSFWPMIDGFLWLPQLPCPSGRPTLEYPSEVPNRMKLHLFSALTSWYRILYGLLICIRYTSWEAETRMNIRVIQAMRPFRRLEVSIGRLINSIRGGNQLPDLTEDEMMAYGCGEFLDCGSIWIRKNRSWGRGWKGESSSRLEAVTLRSLPRVKFSWFSSRYLVTG